MAILAQCHGCGRQYQILDRFEGQTVPCKSCGTMFDVPLSDDYSQARAHDDYDNYRSRQPRRRSSRTREVFADEAPTSSRGLVIGLSIVGGVVVLAGLIFAVVFLFSRDNGKNDEPAAKKELADGDNGDGQIQPRNGNARPPAKPQLPAFPELPVGRLHSSGAKIHFVQLHGSGPGQGTAMRVYVPPGEHAAKSLGCVLVAPAGTTLLHGNDMDNGDYHAETLPYVRAGYAVVCYSIDGPLANRRQATDAQLAAAYRQFKAANAGVTNGQVALEYVLAKLPQVNPGRIYCAGHSSAGTLSLLLGAQEKRIAGCIAYAPAADVESRLSDVINDGASRRLLPGLSTFLRQSSPMSHVNGFHCPVFVFHSRTDGNTPFRDTERFVRKMQQAEKNLTFSVSNSGDHYNSMINPGIPRGIAWLKNLPSERSGSSTVEPPPSRTTPPPTRPTRPPVLTTGRVMKFQVRVYRGRGDATAAARRALRPYKWIKNDGVVYDAANREIVMPLLTGSFSSFGPKSALERAGFSIGGTTITSQ